jgi:hypothetical protein
MTYINNGYVDKISYNNDEIINVYCDGNENYENIIINITNINKEITKTIKVDKIEKQTCGVKNYTGFGNYKTVPTFINNNNNNTAWIDFKYQLSFSFSIEKFESGIYLIDNKIKFIVKNNRYKITYIYPSNTEFAYNPMGGKSLYHDWRNNDKKDISERAQIVGIHRPHWALYTIDKNNLGILPWLSGQDYKINYICDSDMENKENIKNTQLFIIGGHGEYWSKLARINLDHYINQGVNVLNLSGNSLWWCIEYNEDKSQIICIKKQLDHNTKHLDTIEYVNNEFPDNVPNNISDFAKNFKKKNSTFKNDIKKYLPFYTLGVDYTVGGFGTLTADYRNKKPTIYHKCKDNIILKNVNNNTINVPTIEFDGIFMNVVDKGEIKGIFDYAEKIKIDENYLIENIDKLQLNEDMYKYFKYKNLIMLSNCYYANTIRFTGIIAVKKDDDTGIILNMSSMSWCSKFCFDGESSNDIKTITKNSINALLSNNSMDLFK